MALRFFSTSDLSGACRFVSLADLFSGGVMRASECSSSHPRHHAWAARGERLTNTPLHREKKPPFPRAQAPISEFIDEHCRIFEDTEETLRHLSLSLSSLSLYPSVDPSMQQSIHPSIDRSIYPSIYPCKRFKAQRGWARLSILSFVRKLAAGRRKERRQVRNLSRDKHGSLITFW